MTDCRYQRIDSLVRTATLTRNSRLRRCMGRLAGLGLILILASSSVDALLYGQNAAKKKTTKADKAAKGDPKTEGESPQLEELDFGSAQMALLDEGATVELDETSDGKERLRELLKRSREIFQERDRVNKDRQPLVLPRDLLLGEVVQYNQNIIQAQQAIQRLQTQIRQLQRQASNANSDSAQNFVNDIRLAQNQIGLANDVIVRNQAEITQRTPDIEALNLQIKPLDERLMKLWSELNSARKQWLELRQPQQKYAHGNYEGLKRVIDDWLLIDGLWPDAFCWGALCNYELGNYRDAWDQVEKAAELRKTLNFPKAWAQGEALRGMISAKISERRGKSAGFLQSAGLFVAKDKKTNWETYFLMGRAVCENDKLSGKAKANFEKALKINPEAACVRYWYGRLQTTTSNQSIRDVAAGTATLEDLWKRSTKQSWRLAHSMVMAYDAGDRTADAKATWELVLSLAPQSAHQELEKERTAAQEQKKSAETDPKPKSKKSKST